MLLKSHTSLFHNLLKNYGYVKKDKIVHTDYKLDPKTYKPKQSNKISKKSQKKEKRAINHCMYINY